MDIYTGGDPIDAIQLAEDHGHDVYYSDTADSFVLGTTIYVPRKTRTVRVQWRVAHELAHVLLRLAGEDESSESAANYVAGAMLTSPRTEFMWHLREGWDLERLRRQYPTAPAHAIAVRVVQLRAAMAAVYDEGRLRRRWGDAFDGERVLVDEVLATGRPARVDACTGAWPIFDGRHRRVIVLAPAA